MKLYANPAGPRRENFYISNMPPASAFVLEQQLLRAYREVLYNWWDIDLIIIACFGPKHGKSRAHAEDRLQYEVPELLERMSPQELEVAAGVFAAHTLVGFIWHVLRQERTIQHRLGDGNCSTRLDDDSHARAAGLGKGQWTQAVIRRPKRVCRCSTQEKPVEAPIVALKDPTPPPVNTIPALPRHLQVKRTQERRRLKRKRR